MKLEFSANISLAGNGVENDEGIEVYGSAKAFILKQGEEGTSDAEICRKAGIGQSTYFAWSKEDQKTVWGTVFPTHEIWRAASR